MKLRVAAAAVVAVGVAAVPAAAGTVRATVLASPLTVFVATAKTSAKTGQQITVGGAVRNETPLTLSDARLTLRAAPAVDIRGGETRTRASLAGGATWSELWQVCARRAGNYVLLASAQARGVLAAESSGTVVTVTGKDSRC